MDPCRLCGGNPFSTPVKQPRLEQPGRESRMVVMNCARDGFFPAPRELEPGCDLGRDYCQCLRVIIRDNMAVLAQVNGFSVDKHPGGRFKCDASALVWEREVKCSKVSVRTMWSPHARQQRRVRCWRPRRLRGKSPRGEHASRFGF